VTHEIGQAQFGIDLATTKEKGPSNWKFRCAAFTSLQVSRQAKSCEFFRWFPPRSYVPPLGYQAQYPLGEKYDYANQSGYEVLELTCMGVGSRS
jgi:hypothetical protein